ncbi:MAG: bifunctional 5,10-methylene-tetrahydrofolate dehydrogenase/5,10-methylene-tetrahydrofolate cyclohydrolase [Oscillospiraceae bacterium]|nr:bifunctional 5,10-methylene-tetrahydrofolate dehydrogenase/5,10-methylene-tetrahydrofolate cyclohydrolase [Oscillospiraceae bacterium]
MKLIDGKAASAALREMLKKEVENLEQAGITPGLAVILIGNDPAVRASANGKKRACTEMGLYFEEYPFPNSVRQQELVDLIQKLNKKPDIDGITIQAPLPNHINREVVLSAIAPEKDVDGGSFYHAGRLFCGAGKFTPCVAASVLELLDRNGIDVAGKECVVVGRSNAIGKPIALTLMQRNGTVTVCHSKTRNLKTICKRAEILVTAVGKAKFFGADHVKPGAVVIDVGMDRDEAGRICGDVDIAAIGGAASVAAQAPEGIAPMAVTMLIKNTIQAAKR